MDEKIKMKMRIIIAIQGAAGVGKTSVVRKLCRKLPGKTARVSVDILNDMSCSNTKTQKGIDEFITMAKRASLDLVKFYLKEGCNVVLEFSPPIRKDEGATDKWLARELKKMGGRVFLIHASLPEVLKRNKARRGEFGQGNLSKKLTEKIYGLYEDYIDKTDYELIDTEKFGADKTAKIILEKIKKRR